MRKILDTTLNFLLPAGTENHATMLSVEGQASLAGSQVNVGLLGSESTLAKGDIVTLIDAQALVGTPVNSSSKQWKGLGKQGVTLMYDFNILSQNNQLLAEVDSGSVVTQGSKSLSEAFIAGPILVTTAGHSIEAPDMGGPTGIGEIGLVFRPKADSPFSVDLGAQGYIGERQGVTGSVNFKFEF